MPVRSSAHFGYQTPISIGGLTSESRPMTQPNTLFYGDNLPVLREHIAAASVDLVYLDPPFNSSRSYTLSNSFAWCCRSPIPLCTLSVNW